MLATPTDTAASATLTTTDSSKVELKSTKAELPSTNNINQTTYNETLSFTPLKTISQLKQAELQPIKMMVNLLMEAVVVVDEHGTIQLINEHAIDLLVGDNINNNEAISPDGLSRTEEPMSAPALIGQQWQTYLLEPQKSLYQKMVIESRTGARPLNHPPAETTLRLMDKSNKDVEVSITHFALSTPMFAIVIRDLTKYRMEYKQLHQWASTDCLTKLANRRVFDAELQNHWQSCTDKQRPISVLLIDIDHFKIFNDKYGHILGDYCLQKIAQAIESSLPDADCTAARYGGEEFAIIMPNCNAKQVEQTARLVQKNINDLTYMDIGLDASVSVSVSQGHASEINGQYRTSTALLCAADTALYRAKADGRNRINACL